jgi:hypothetical protein
MKINPDLKAILAASVVSLLAAAGLAYAGVYTIGAPTEAGSLVLQSGTTGGTVTVGAPSGLSTAVTFTLPNSNGTVNQTLQTNGSGITSWVTPAGGGNVSTNTTNAYVSPSVNTYASGVEIVGPSTTISTGRPLTATDCGSTLFMNAAALTMTLFATAPVGCTVTFVQQATGQTTIAPGSATLNSVNTYTKTKGQWAVIAVTAVTASIWVLSGDGA